MIPSTRAESLESIDRTLTQKRREVFNHLKRWGPMTSLEVSDGMGIPINCVSGRITELCEVGKIEAKGRKKQRTGRSAMLWGVKEARGQGELF